MDDLTTPILYPEAVRFAKRDLATADGYSPATIIFWEASEEWTADDVRPSKLRHLVATTASKIVGRVMMLPGDETGFISWWWEVPGWCFGYAESREDAKAALVASLRHQHDWTEGLDED